MAGCSQLVSTRTQHVTARTYPRHILFPFIPLPGETDWKLIVINAEDRMAHLLRDVDDLEVHLPGTLAAVTRWLRFYKQHEGITNDFAFDGVARGQAYAEAVLKETHESWERLIESRGREALV